MSCKKKKAEYYYENFKNFSVKIPWDCFVRILIKMLGFEMKFKSGSARLFMKGNIRFNAHEPHHKGDKNVHKSDRERAIFQIESSGIILKKGGKEE